MTVRELIAELASWPQDMPVYVGALCDDYDEVIKVEIRKLEVRAHPDFQREIDVVWLAV